MWFRGQSDYSWGLVPSVQRKDGMGKNYEQYISTNFMIHTMRLNSNAPQRYDRASWLTLMQHYGLPTRLLDWSESPLVALYFALSSNKNAKTDAAVWVLNPMKLNKKVNYGEYVPPISYDSLRGDLEGAFSNHDNNDYDSDAQMADYYAAIDMAMLPVDTITNELPKKFRRWIESLKVDSSVKPLSGLVKPGAKYLDFNYTEFAETLYGAKGVCYIHGSRKNRKAKLILGHSYKKYVSDVSVKMPRFKDGFKRGMVNAAFDDAMVHAGWYDQATTKNSRQIIKEHEGFFDGLSDIDTVIVIGHSLSEVGMEYFEKICSEIHSDAKWIFSCHDSAGLKAINAFVKTMAIGADRVTLFRL